MAEAGPPRGFHKAITALATLEQKLRRQLGLAGTIGATFVPELRPILIAGDLREPGNSDGFSGRWWSYAQIWSIGGANNCASVRFDTTVLLSSIYCDPAAGAGNIFVYLSVPGAAPGINNVSIPAGTWVDNKMIATDQVPIQESIAAGAAAVSETRTTTIGTWQAGVSAKRDVMMYLPVGTHLNIRAAGAGGNVAFGFAGRIWP